jgi:hypothetical protein
VRPRTALPNGASRRTLAPPSTHLALRRTSARRLPAPTGAS